MLGSISVVGPANRLIAGCLAVVFLAGCRSDVESRIARAYSLARHPSDGNKNRIEALLGDPDRDVRTTALVVMGRIDADRARAMALRSLGDPDGMVRATAVDFCADTGDPAIVRLLAARSIEDPVWHVRARSLAVIASHDDDLAVRDAFAQALSDPVRHVRRAALIAGVRRPGLLPVERLSEILASDSDWENRVEAARALGVSGGAASVASLDAAVSDPNEFVRATAAQELRELARAAISP